MYEEVEEKMKREEVEEIVKNESQDEEREEKEVGRR